MPVSQLDLSLLCRFSFLRCVSFVKLQRQSVRVVEEGHPFSREGVETDRLTGDAQGGELSDGLLDVRNMKRQVPQAAGLGVRGPLRRVFGGEDLKLRVAVELQVKLLVPLLGAVVFPQHRKAQLVNIEAARRCVVRDDDCNVMNGVQLHGEAPSAQEF